ncbi:MAG: protein translocase subunit SecD [Chloroflexi bacterium HGW-Chloroflexi-4]|jgi:preprotein translocase subunit SecD|nr:MAG: protein translocase subunit SecD [Chloroflexi bacterium HGW-Chloroflexi-4]
MDRRYINFILILLLVAGIVWIDLPRAEGSAGIKIGTFERSLNPVLGLDLRGGMQVLLAPPEGSGIDKQALEDAALTLENRANGLGVSEVVFQVAGDNYILGEFPGLTNTEEVIATVKQTGLLEFVDAGTTFLPEGTVINTDHGQTEAVTNDPAVVPVVNSEGVVEPADYVFHTVMLGSEIENVSVEVDQTGGFIIPFEVSADSTKMFREYTGANINKNLAIVLDKKVISCPTIQGALDGGGQISGNFTSETANNLAVTLRYGRLPVALEVVESRIIGPTLGEDSLSKSLLAGAIGFGIVILFMLIYYRLPGAVAVLSIAIYAGLTFALFKLIPVTLTLPSIAGFLLSTGSALDANILIFERLKEELRNGRTLQQAIDLGWKRAWPSIRDSNIATIITSIILFWFGSAFGASIVKGFALTLALGVGVSLFTAILVTRNFLSIVIKLINPARHQKWFGA